MNWTEFDLAIGSLTTAMAVAGNLLTKLEKAQKDLEKPTTHEWKHGDVFRFSEESIMIYIHENPEVTRFHPQVFRISSETATAAPVETYLKDAKFLFNIKEKL